MSAPPARPARRDGDREAQQQRQQRQRACGGGVAGARAPFAEVVASSTGLVRAIAMRIVQNAADADDVVQETFARVHVGLPLLRDAGALRGFIARIAHHVAVDVVRARVRRGGGATALDLDDDTHADTPVSDAPSAEEQLTQREERAALKAAVRALPPPQRAVIERYALGASAPQIAAALGVPVGTVESRLHRARAALRVRLLAEGDGDPLAAWSL